MADNFNRSFQLLVWVLTCKILSGGKINGCKNI